jgi:hypothetical protein
MKGWYTAKQVITEALAILGDFEQKQYESAAIHFMRCYRDFSLFHSTSFTKVWLPVTPIKTVTLPEDFLELVWVGTHFRGEVWTFTKNSRILSPSDPLDQTLNATRHEDSTLMVSPLRGYAAKGANEMGYFNLNLRQNRIELKKAFLHYYNQSDMTEVYLGYIGNDIKDINTAYVPASAVNLITTGIAYQLTLSSSAPVSSREQKSLLYLIGIREREFLKASTAYDALNFPSADELRDAIYQTSGQSIR